MPFFDGSLKTLNDPWARREAWRNHPFYSIKNRRAAMFPGYVFFLLVTEDVFITDLVSLMEILVLVLLQRSFLFIWHMIIGIILRDRARLRRKSGPSGWRREMRGLEINTLAIMDITKTKNIYICLLESISK